MEPRPLLSPGSAARVTVPDPQELVLRLWLSERRLVLATLQEDRQACLWAEEHPRDEQWTPEDFLRHLSLLTETHPVLSRPFWRSIEAIVSTQAFTFIPEMLFRPEYAARYLSVAGGLETDATVQHQAHPNWGLTNAFALPDAWEEWLMTAFPFGQVQLWHQMDVLLSLGRSLGPEKSLLVQLEPGAVSLLHADGPRLRYGNRFLFKEVTDVVYVVLFVMRQLDLHPAQVPVYVFGQVQPDDELCQALYPYVAEVRVGLPERTPMLPLPENAPAYHTYATLLHPLSFEKARL